MDSISSKEKSEKESRPTPEDSPSGKSPTAPHLPSRIALRHRMYLIYMVGSFVSLVGDWMDIVTLNWAVLKLTDSALNLGVVNACRLIPVFLLSLPAGILADRVNRRWLLIILQACMMVLTFVVGWLVAIRAPFWLFTVVVTIRAIFGAMTLPVRNVLISNLVPQVAVASAIATQSSTMSICRIIGPALAGFLLLYFPLESLFWINGCSFIFVLLTLFVVRPIADEKLRRPNTELEPQAGVIRFIRNNSAIQSLLVLAIVPMVFGFPYTTLMPLFARDLLNVGPAGFGLLLSLAGIGTLLASLWLSVAKTEERVGPLLILSIIGFGVGLILFTMAGNYWVAAGIIFLVGLMSQIYRTSSRITVQLQTPDYLRGRILSIAMMDRGFIPLGTLFLGALAEWGGTYLMGLVMGSGCVVITLMVFFFRRQIWTMGQSGEENEPSFGK